MSLSTKNAHPRDSRLVFVDDGHTYTLDGSTACTSVTTLIHTYFPHFDADTVISKMMRSNRWPESKYFGMSSDKIKAQWAAAGEAASTAGTNMHYAIECFYNGDTSLLNAASGKEMSHFRAFYADHTHLKPYRTEWTVFDEDALVAGSIDMVFVDPSDTGSGSVLQIYDWKRSKKIEMFNAFQSGYGPFKDLSDCNYIHYALQLNTYKYILETRYGKKVTELKLVVLHPDNDTYLVVAVPDMQTYVQAMMSAARDG
jgi:ATP-dependent exoDNAse (exonuclease V) beta subunit